MGNHSGTLDIDYTLGYDPHDSGYDDSPVASIATLPTSNSFNTTANLLIDQIKEPNLLLNTNQIVGNLDSDMKNNDDEVFLTANMNSSTLVKNTSSSKLVKTRVPKSKSIGIALNNNSRVTDKFNNKDDDDDDDEDDDACFMDSYTDDDNFYNDINLNKLKISQINAKYSSSWSPNSTINTAKDFSALNNSNTSISPLLIDTNTEKLTANSNSTLTTSPTTVATYSPKTPTHSVASSVLSSSPYQSILKGMNFVGRFAKGVKEFYNEINPATLTGAIDVIVVRQEDDTFKCSPFHVRFGKLGVIRSKEKVVDIEINGEPVDLHMELGDAGEAYFLEKISDDEDEEESQSSTESLNAISKDKGESKLKASQSMPINHISDSFKEGNTKHSFEQQSSFIPLNRELIEEETLPVISSTQPIAITSTNQVSHGTINSSNSSAPESSIAHSPIEFQLTPKETNKDEKKVATTSKTPQTAPQQMAPNPPNFFSDGEITPELTSPAVSRPPTPKSDTELEMHKTKRQSISSEISNSNQWSWSWGQLPERQNNNSKQNNNNPETIKEQDSKSSTRLLGGMFKFSGSNNTTGIYLDDTEKLDSEIAALYLDQKSNKTSSMQSNLVGSKQSAFNAAASCNDEDQESGRGQSLPQSPRDYYSILGDVQISLCGFINQQPTIPLITTTSPISNGSTSNLNKLTSSSSNSLIPNNENVLNTSASSTSTLLTISPATSTTNLAQASGPSSPNSDINAPSTSNDHVSLNFDDLFQQYTVPFEKFMDELQTITSNPNLVIKINNRYMNWQAASTIILSALVYQRQLPNDVVNTMTNNSTKTNDKLQQQQQQPQQQTTQPAASKSSWGKNLLFWGSKKSSTAQTANQQATSVTPINEASKSVDEETSIVNNLSKSVNEATDKPSQQIDSSQTVNTESNETDSKASNINQRQSTSTSDNLNKKSKYRRTTRLSSDLINKLNLRPGPNEIKYSVTTALQGTTRIESYVFLWNYDDKIIISDIDGTITKSDVWGQILPIIGRDWSQAGVADLFTAIERNEYKFIYLSARAIGQSKLTRDLLRNINQNGFTLPDGPLLVTPTSLFTAFQKEVIEKKPEEFKINCLKDIQTLFPDTGTPYYAGYGNKSTDVTAYKAVGIPISRIFTINPQGELKHEVSRSFQSSYSQLCDKVDLIFPPFKPSSSLVKPEYDSFHYWRDTAQTDIFLDEILEELKQINQTPSTSSSKDASANNGNQKENSKSNKKSLSKLPKSQSTIINSSSSLRNSTSESNDTNALNAAKKKKPNEP